MKTLFTSKATAEGGRSGHTGTADGKLSFTMSAPDKPTKEGKTTNPEELFACAYAACFGGALEVVAEKKNVALKEAKVTAEVSLNSNESGVFLGVTLDVSIFGIDSGEAEKLVQEAHKVCPYSKATRGNIEVILKVNSRQLSQAA